MVIGIDIRIPLMIVSCTCTTFGMYQSKPVAIQVGIEMVAAQWSKTLCMFDIESIVNWWNRVKCVKILCCSLTTIGIECRFNKNHGIAQSFYDICILGSHKIIGCQY